MSFKLVTEAAHRMISDNVSSWLCDLDGKMYMEFILRSIMIVHIPIKTVLKFSNSSVAQNCELPCSE
jgi:hypothetical protein